MSAQRRQFSRLQAALQSLDWLGALEAMPDGVLISDAQGVIRHVNERGARMFGFSPKDMLGLSVEELIPESLRARHVHHRTRFERSPRPRGMEVLGEMRARRQDGTEFPVEISLNPFPTPEGTMVFAAIRDASERQRMVSDLRRQTSQVRLLQGVVSAANQSSNLVDAASQCLRLIGHQFGYELGHLFVVNAQLDGELVSSAFWRADGPERYERMIAMTETATYRRGRGIVGRALAEGQPCSFLLPKQADSVRLKLAADVGLDAVVVVPIRVGHEVVGMLEFFAAGFEGLDDDVLATFDHVGAQLGRVVERERADQALRESELRFRSVVQTANDAVVLADASGAVVLWNLGAQRIFGFDEADALGTPLASVFVPEAVETLQHTMDSLASDADLQHTGSTFCVNGQRRDGSEVPLEVSLSAWRSGDVGFFSAIMRDVSQRLAAEKTIQAMAYFDALTGLANKTLFTERLSQAVTVAEHRQNLVGVLLLDVDRFKVINDSLGHAVGDVLLRQIGQRLARLASPTDTVARLGGDEFAIVMGGLGEAEQAVRVAETVLRVLAEPFHHEGTELVLTPSIGISMFPLDGTDAAQLVKNAEAAMYRAKGQRNSVQIFAAGMASKTRERLILENDLRKAVDRGEIALHYQPQVNPIDGIIIGAEALIRWYHPTRGLIGPAQFIPLAEETGLIVGITDHVLATACRQAVAWRKAGLPAIRVAVNLSARYFQQQRLVETVDRALADAGLEAIWLDLEVTESLLMENVESALPMLSELHARGVRLSIDDFGTGYSSLSYLKRLPIRALKIDRSFIMDIESDRSSAAIVRSIIDMAHHLELDVVAEGVETDDQLTFLRALGCDEIQGYFYSKPVPEAEFAELLRSGGRWRRAP